MDFLNKKYRFEVEWIEEAMSESFDLMIESVNLTDDEKEELKKVVFGWAEEGIEKGYGGEHISYISNNARWEITEGKDYFDVYIDMGAASETAFGMLLDGLENLKVPIEKVYFGKNTIELKEQLGLPVE